MALLIGPEPPQESDTSHAASLRSSDFVLQLLHKRLDNCACDNVMSRGGVEGVGESDVRAVSESCGSLAPDLPDNIA